MLFYNDDDIRDLPLKIRRQKLEDWMKRVKNSRLDISEILDFDSWSLLAELRTEKADTLGHEGVMIKDLQSNILQDVRKVHGLNGSGTQNF